MSFTFWLLIWALVSGQAIHAYHAREMPIPWLKIALSLGDHLQWGIVAPFVVWFCARKPVARPDLLGGTLYQLVAWVLFPAAFALPIFGWRSVLASTLGNPSLGLELTLDSFLRVYVWAFLAYLDVVVVAHAFYYARELRSRERKASLLETRLAQARLDVLRMQIHPHFLFNTLNSIATLMHRDVAAAERMLVQLADLLRDSLARGDAQTVSLARELEFLDKYIEIEMTRFGERLSVVRNVDPVALDAEVPSLLLQPLVENALRHGLAMKPGPGRLTLSAARDGSALEIRVRDDGAGLPKGAPIPESGVGLGTTRARLEEMYGPEHSFVARMPEDGGFEVVVRFPFRPNTRPHGSGRPTAFLGPRAPSGPHEAGAPAAPNGAASTIASSGSDVSVVPHGSAAAAVSARAS